MFGSWPPPLWMAEFALMFSLCLRVSWRYARGIISTDNALFSRWDAPQLDRVVLDAVREDDAGKRRNQQTSKKKDVCVQTIRTSYRDTSPCFSCMKLVSDQHWVGKNGIKNVFGFCRAAMGHNHL